MVVDPTIFKAYDIRGIYPQSLDEKLAYKIGQAFAKLLTSENRGKKLQVVLSRDARIHSPGLSKSVADGILDSGIDVVDIGLSSTPTFYFAVGYYGYDGGIQVSASHNPPQWNGMKMVRAKSVPISGESGISQMKDWIVSDQLMKTSTRGEYSEKANVIKDEIRVQSEGVNWKAIKPFKIVIDTGNGMGGIDMEELFSGLPCNLVKLFFELDGSFPNHIADPLKEENQAWTKKTVIESHADLGIVVDGDGDRYFIIDETGQTLRQEILRGIMAQIALEENPGATVCYDIRPGRITRDMIEAKGGKAVVTRVGHSLIKETMLAENAAFGGESSGHYFYRFPYGTFEAPLVLVQKFLIFLSGKNLPLSKIVHPYEVYFHSGEINSDVSDKEAKIQELSEKYADAKISHLDGITIEYPEFWFNVRPSNTENKLRLNLEAVTKEIMEQKRDEVLGVIRG